MELFGNGPSLYENPRLYDIVVTGSDGETDFFAQAARRQGDRTLELACGTGRIANALTERGLPCDGLDISAAMLEQARADAARRGLDATFYLGDMTNFSLDTAYDLVFVAINSLLHVHDFHDLARVFRCVSQCLTAGGEFIFSVFNPSIARLARSGKREPIMRFEHPDTGEEVLVEEMIQYDSRAQVNHSTWHYSMVGRGDVFSHPLELRCLFPQEVDLLCEYSGFTVRAKYGDYSGTPFDAQSRQQIVCARPRTQAGPT